MMESAVDTHSLAAPLSHKETNGEESSASRVAPQGKPRLHYFPLMGRAEPIRILLAHAQVDYDDVRLSFDTFERMKEQK